MRGGCGLPLRPVSTTRCCSAPAAVSRTSPARALNFTSTLPSTVWPVTRPMPHSGLDLWRTRSPALNITDSAYTVHRNRGLAPTAWLLRAHPRRAPQIWRMRQLLHSSMPRCPRSGRKLARIPCQWCQTPCQAVARPGSASSIRILDVHEHQRLAVHAVPLTRGHRAVGEDVAEVAVAARAQDLHSRHAVACDRPWWRRSRRRSAGRSWASQCRSRTWRSRRRAAAGSSTQA